MSLGLKVPFDEALEIARTLVAELEPVCARVKVAGSLRRKRPHVSDIELVVEPRPEPADLFGEVKPDIASIRHVAQQWGEILKGGSRYIQVRTLMRDLKCGLFLAHPPANWWVILAIRTGPATLGQWAVSRMHDHGYQCQDGRIIEKATGRELAVTSEADFFRAAGLPCLPPTRRDSDAALQQLAAAEQWPGVRE